MGTLGINYNELVIGFQTFDSIKCPSNVVYQTAAILSRPQFDYGVRSTEGTVLTTNRVSYLRMTDKPYESASIEVIALC